MKHFTLILTLALLFMSSCAAIKQAQQDESDQIQQSVKDILRETYDEREANLEKYNVTCDYTDRPGTVTIIQLDPLKDDQLMVSYKFTPSEASDRDKEFELGDRNRTLIIDGTYPTIEWCEKNGVKVGASFPASRMEIVKGEKTEYCEQVNYKIPSLGILK